MRDVIEEQLEVKIKSEEMYYGSDNRAFLSEITQQIGNRYTAGLSMNAIAPTKSLLRLLAIVRRCIEQKEPVLLVGGKNDV